MPKRENIKKALIIGSGPIIIGQAAEFDYSGSQALKSLREEGVQTVLANSNPATIQTDTEMADATYIEPLTVETVEKIIEKERPDGILSGMGGQTALNLTAELAEHGILEKYKVKVLGTPVSAIVAGEDREKFRDLMVKIGEPVPPSKAVTTVKDALEYAEQINYPVIVRAAFTLGGTGSGVAGNPFDLERIASNGIALSRIHQVLIEKSVAGWKEIEYEVMRDSADNCITVCNMENFDPMGIHTGESIVVAPSQTLSDYEYQMLRTAAIKIIRALGVEGGCNIQFALDPNSEKYYIIEVNPRVSRSSALASKATGYPIAFIAAKIAIGLTLDEISNPITKETKASFEPALDYIVTKIPRWPFEKFRTADRTLGTQMKSTGEVMAIGRNFEESLQKAIRSLDIDKIGLVGNEKKDKEKVGKAEIEQHLIVPTHKRLFQIVEALKSGFSVEKIAELTKIDKWFIAKILHIVEIEKMLPKAKSQGLKANIEYARKFGFIDEQIENIIGRRIPHPAHRIPRSYKMVDTCAAEFEAKTPYYYSTSGTKTDVRTSEKKKVIILGSGPIRIGQGIEFDYCTVHAVWALRELGYEAIIINNNPETVSTDYDTSDRLYFEPLHLEDVLSVCEVEKPYGIITQFGGQTAVNLSLALKKHGVKVLGTTPNDVDRAENRDEFAKVLKKLKIPQAKYGIAYSYKEAKKIAEKLSYPVLVRPSYVLGGRAMEIVHTDEDLETYMKEAVKVSKEHPIRVDKFLDNAIELDVDAVCDGKDVFIGGIMEHIEEAGVHSGDASCVVPPQTLSRQLVETVKDFTRKILLELKVVGMANIQYAIKDNVAYVLEANLRSSRTVPFISKAIGVQLAKVGTKAIMGKSLKELGLAEKEIIPCHVSVKSVVFPFDKLPGADIHLGPEMKSTGESMGIGYDFGEAFYKAQQGAYVTLPKKGRIFFAVNKNDKKFVAGLAKTFVELGFEIISVGNTAKIISLENIPVTKVLKASEGAPNVVDLIKEKGVDLVINTPTSGGNSAKDGFKIRRACITAKIPCITTMSGAFAALKAIKKIKESDFSVKSLNEYHSAKEQQPLSPLSVRLS